MRKSFDYIICGAGASGLLLANAMIEDKFFRDKKILLIEKDKKSINDRTWGLWDNKTNVLDSILHKSWNHAEFIGKSFKKHFGMGSDQLISEFDEWIKQPVDELLKIIP